MGQKRTFSGVLMVLIFSVPFFVIAHMTYADTSGQTDVEVSISDPNEHIRTSGYLYVTEQKNNALHWVKLDVGADADGKIQVDLVETQEFTTLAENKLTVDQPGQNVDGDFQILGGGSRTRLTIKNGVITGPSGKTNSNAVGIVIADDTRIEGPEQFEIRFTKTGGNIKFPNDAQELRLKVWITDNSDTLALTVDTEPNTTSIEKSTRVAEGTLAKFRFSLERPLEEGEYAQARIFTDIRAPIDFLQTNQTVASNDDFSAFSDENSKLITWKEGQQHRDISIPTTSDNIDELDEVFALVVSHGGSSGVDVSKISPYSPTRPSVLVTIQDDDPHPEISVTSPIVPEGDSGISTMSFNIKLDRPSEKGVTVNYRLFERSGDATSKKTADENKEAGKKANTTHDYIGVEDGKFTFAPGEIEKTVKITIEGDPTEEQNERIVLRLENPENATFVGGGANLDGVGTIVNDDTPLTITLRAPGSATKEGEVATFRIELDRAWSEDIAFQWWTVGPTYGNSKKNATIELDFSMVVDGFTCDATCEGVIKQGETVKTLLVEIKSDKLDEKIEEYIVVLGLLGPPGKFVLKGDGPFASAVKAIGTILDGTAVSVLNAEVVTEGADAVFPIELTEPLAKDVEITLGTEDGSATDGLPTGSGEGHDYKVKTDEKVIISAGKSRKEVRVETLQDYIDEGREEFYLKIKSAVEVDQKGKKSTTNIEIDQTRGKATIRDDDARPRMNIADAPTITEGGTAVFTVSLSEESDRPVSVRWQTADGNGQNPAQAEDRDYKFFVQQTLTIPAGELSAEIQVPTYDDVVPESSETFRVLLSHAPNAALIDGEGIGTIEDDDMPTVYINKISSFELLDGGVDKNKRVELDGGRIPESWDGMGGLPLAVYFDIKLSAPAPYDVKVKARILNGNDFGRWPASPRSGGGQGEYDKSKAEGEITIESGKTRPESEVSVLVYDDTKIENDEVFRLQLYKATNAKIDAARDTGMVTILDDDGIRYLISPGQPNTVKEGKKIKIRFERRPKNIDHILGGWAERYRTPLLRHHFRVCLIGGIESYENYKEKPEDGRANIGGGEIKKDDDVYLAKSTPTGEGNHCRVKSDAGLGSYVSIGFNKSASPWEHTVEIITTDDDLVEGDEKFTLQFEITDPYNSSRTVPEQSRLFRYEITIIDDDVHRIKVDNARAKEGDTVDFKIFVDPKDPKPKPGDTATFYYNTVDGSATKFKDYTSVDIPRQITLTAPADLSNSWGTISVPTTQDNKFEPDETFTLKLSKPSKGYDFELTNKGKAIGTIEDNDIHEVSFVDTVVEEGDKAVVTARLNRASDYDVTVDWSTEDIGDKEAKAGIDYTGVTKSTLTIKAGETTAKVKVLTTEDDKDEPDEDFHVQVINVTPSNVIKGPNAAVVAIRDDDPGSVSFGDQESITIEENEIWRSNVPTVSGQPHGDVNWTISGADAKVFSINAETGQLTLSAQNFERPTDADKDNVYEVVVRAVDEDGNQYVSKSPVEVSVTDVNTVEVKLATPDPVTEGETINITVVRNEADKSINATLKWQTLVDSDGSNPAAETDYAAVSETQVLNLANDANTVVSIDTTSDQVDETDETFRFRLSDLSDSVTDDAVFVDDKGKVIAGPIEVVLTITDDDTRGVTVSPTTLT
ncbi:MAG: hypothetical protein OXI60_11595, partial [Acidiferrobacterales bacterium]|nr:hypothetical protein [Acidiferrobacterales bacterium]